MPDTAEVNELERRMLRLGWRVLWEDASDGYVATARSYEPDSGERLRASGENRPEALRDLLRTVSAP